MNRYGLSLINYMLRRYHDPKRVPVMEILQLDSVEIADITHQQDVIIMILFRQIVNIQKSEQQENYQWLKQIGFDFNNPVIDIPTVFVWINCIMIHSDTPDLSPKAFGDTLRTLLALGTDICARWRQLTPLQYLFHKHGPRKAYRKENRLLIVKVATALLENGAELFVLDDDGLCVFHIAKKYGLIEELLIAILLAGYDLKVVVDQIIDLHKVFNNPNCGIAKSTAIDNAQVAPSFTTGLVSRKAIIGDRLED